ncbi:MAG: YgaP family membrane protein [Fibrobacterota bacterium]
MKKNMGTTDKIIRVLLAAIFGVLYVTETISGAFGIVLLVLAGVFVVTGVIGFCPLYAPFGITTCSSKKTE